MQWYRELLPNLPEEINGWIALPTVPKVCGIVWCYTGPLEKADDVMAPVRAFGSPLMVGLAKMPFSSLQQAFNGLYPPGLQWYWRSDFSTDISDAAIAVHKKYGALLPTGHSTMHMYPLDGAAARVPSHATAFGHRDGG